MTEDKNTVFVELYNLSITERTDDRFGKVMISRSIDEDDLINIAKNRHTDLTPATLRASMELLKGLAIECILRGDSVKFGMAFFSLDVKGVFLGDNASWDSTEHKLIVRTTPTSDLRQAVNSASVKIHGMASVGTFINSVTDVASGEVNTMLTLGGGVNVTGSKIKIAGEHPDNGLYLVNMADEASLVLISMNSILINDPSNISFIMPAELPPGDYKLKIITQFTTSNKTLKEPRTYVFNQPLAIV